MKHLVPDAIQALAAYQIPHPAGIRAKLDANECPYPLPPDVADALGRHLATVDLNRYPDGAATALRARVAHDLGRAPEELVFGNGSDELIALMCAAFARPRPGRAQAVIAYPGPSFVVFRIAALAHGLRPVEIPLAADFTLDPEATERVIAEEQPNLVFFALPNNPTGTLWPRAEVVRVAERHPDVLVVSDEAYHDYCGETLLDLVGRLPNLVVMRTFSKLGLAALRCGFLVAPRALADYVDRVRPPYNVGAVNQAATLWLLTHHASTLRTACARVVGERDRVVGALAAAPGLAPFPTRANFVLVRVGQPGDGQATALWQRLVEHGVLVRNFDRPGPLQGCLRVTIGTPEENDLLVAALPR